MSLTSTDTAREPRKPIRLDKVIIAILAIFILLFVLAPQQGLTTLGDVGASLLSTGPFLLISVAIAAYATASGADNLIARVFAGRTAVMIFAAAAFGALSPFCSCGVIPIIAALLSMGVPLAPVMAFWLASPIMDPSMFVMTGAVLGVDFALVKMLSAISIGLFGGFGLLALSRLPLFADPLRDGVGNGGCGASSVRTPKPVAWTFWQESARLEKFRAGAAKNLMFLGKWLVLAFTLESLMITYVPAEWISTIVGGSGMLPIAIATVTGVPAYLNGFAALPLVDGLIAQGMLPGAALSFMVAGGVTCIPAAIAVFALVKRPVFFAYLAFALTGSFTVGVLYQLALALL